MKTLEKHPQTKLSMMNIDSRCLFSQEFDHDIQIGDLFHTKGKNVTGFGRTWKVTRITPKQIHAVAEDFWFPVFENHPWGRIANGENKDKLEHTTEFFSVQKGKLTAKFWKEGTRVGFPDDGIVHVKVFRNAIG